MLLLLRKVLILLRNKNNRVPDFNSFKTSPGDKHHVTYDSFFRPDGTIDLHEAGREDIQAKINSHAAQTDMAIIIHKLQMGDTSVLSSKPAMFGDFTQFPETYSEVLDIVNRSEMAFQSLSPDIRAKYDNDRNKWFSAIGTVDWLKDMGLYVEPPVEPVNPSIPLNPVPIDGGSKIE